MNLTEITISFTILVFKTYFWYRQFNSPLVNVDLKNLFWGGLTSLYRTGRLQPICLHSLSQLTHITVSVYTVQRSEIGVGCDDQQNSSSDDDVMTDLMSCTYKITYLPNVLGNNIVSASFQFTVRVRDREVSCRDMQILF